MEREIKKIVWDLDNTLWDWVAYATQIYPAMRDVIVMHTGATRERVTANMQAYYCEAETLESSWLVQGLAERQFFKQGSFDQEGLIADLQKIFHSTRAKSLNLYKGVTEVLETADEASVDNQVLTDAPAFHAASRFRHLKVQQSLFHSMHALADGMLRHLPDRHRDSSDGGRYGLYFPVYHTPKEKPHTDLEEVLGMTREEIRKHVVIVGDNFSKDMSLAARYGALGIHAGWGEASPEQLAVLSQFAPKKVMAKNMSLTTNAHSSTRIIRASEPKDIMTVLGWQ